MTKARQFLKKHGIGYAMVLPFILLFFVFTLLPILIAFVISFTDYNMFQPMKFIGFKNYELLFLDDKIFLTAVSNTFVFALIVGPIGFLMSFFAAWVLNNLKLRNAFSLAFYAPSITSGIAMSVVWSYFFSPDRYGLFNNLLTNLGLIEEPILWTQNENYILGVIIVVAIWMSMGNGFLVFLAGMQNVDKGYYEAARIDGITSRYQELKYITLPLMKPQLLFAAITSITSSFGVFDVSVSIGGFPSPNYAGHTIVAHLYDYAFVRFQMGYATAVATILFVITFTLGTLLMRLLGERKENA